MDSLGKTGDGILLALLTGVERGRDCLPTGEVADHAGVPLAAMVHLVPQLIDRGLLDLHTAAGTLRLSPAGAAAARSLRRG